MILGQLEKPYMESGILTEIMVFSLFLPAVVSAGRSRRAQVCCCCCCCQGGKVEKIGFENLGGSLIGSLGTWLKYLENHMSLYFIVIISI